MALLVVLLMSLGLLTQGQSTSYPCLAITGVGCVCGQGYINDGGICKQLLPNVACADGFTWNGTACTKVVDASTSSINLNNSPYGISPSGDGSCPFNSIWNGSQCIKDPNPKPILVSVATNAAQSSIQTYSPTQQLVCQTGYYYNCQTCAPFTGRAVCAGTCQWNGQACVEQQNENNNKPVKSTAFTRFYQGVEGYQDNQYDNRGSNRQQNVRGRSEQIVCPSGHCYNGDRCVTYNGKLNGVNCPRGYDQKTSNFRRQNSNQNNPQIIYLSSPSDLQSNQYQNQILSQIPSQISSSLGLSNSNIPIQAPTGFSLTSSTVAPTSCPPGTYYNGKQCTHG